MATAGPRYPGTTASLANAGTSENANAWTNPGNIVSDNGTEASITAASYDSPDISELLVASNFGFSADIPAGATINGITVEIERRDQAIGAASDNRVQLAKGTAFADLVGNNKADTALDWPTAATVKSYGGASDLWGATWTRDEIVASSFAVFLSVQADAANTDIFVDYIRVTVDYTTAENHNGTVTATGGGVVVASGTKQAMRAEVLTGGGVLAYASTSDHRPALAVAGGGVATLQSSGAHVGSAALTGSGVLSSTQAKGARTAEALTGGGTILASGNKQGLVALGVTGAGETTLAHAGAHASSLAVSGGGIAALGATGDHRSALSATGGGIVVANAATQRAALQSLSGGGSVILAQSTARGTVITLTGGGILTYVYERSSEGDNHFGTLQLTGAGTVTLQGLAARMAALGLTASGTATVSYLAGRQGSAVLTGGGTLAVMIAAAHAAGLSVTGSGSVVWSASGAHFGALEVTGGGTAFVIVDAAEEPRVIVIPNATPGVIRPAWSRWPTGR